MPGTREGNSKRRVEGALAGAAIGALVEVMQERNLPEVEAQPSTGLSLLPSGFGGLSIRFTRRTW